MLTAELNKVSFLLKKVQLIDSATTLALLNEVTIVLA